MRQVIRSGLGIGFFTPIGFIEEIRRGELVHVPLAEPGLAQSRIGILVPRYRRLSPPARLMINHISERLGALRRFLGRAAALGRSDGAGPDMAIVLRAAPSSRSTPPTNSCRRPTSGSKAIPSTALGPTGSLARPGDTLIDCSEALITPGLVNVHTHAATAFYRGMAEDQPREFWSSAGYAMPGQESFTVEDHVLSVRAACAEFLLNGVTCIADRLGNMDRIAPGIEASGIRAVVGHSLVDARAPADWKTADAVIERYGTDPRRRVFAGIAPHALDTCSDALLKECARRAEKTGARGLHPCRAERAGGRRRAPARP